MGKKYEKPRAQDLSGQSAKGEIQGCTSGIGVPNECGTNGYNNATICISAGFTAGAQCQPSGQGVTGGVPALCEANGNFATDCSPTGFGAGA